MPPLESPRPRRLPIAIAQSILLGLLTVHGHLARCGPWMISGNENKIDLTSGSPRVLEGAPPDTLTFLDFGSFPPRIEHLTNVPNTVIGPPSNIAISPDSRVALVANSIRLDPTVTGGFGPESQIHIFDLASKPPRLAGQVLAGRQPSGLSFSADGRRVVVANRADGTLSVLAVEGLRLSVIQTIEVCPPAESVSDVALHPGGRWVLASVQKGGYLAVLEFNEGQLRATGRKVSVYGQPYRCAITPDGRLGLTAGQGLGNGLDLDALTVVRLSNEGFQTIDYVPLGAVPESFEISPDGDLVAAVVMNGSNLAESDERHSHQGGVVLLRRRGDTFEKVQELPVGRIPEGVAFTSDGRHLVVQCHPDRELQIFEVRRGRLRDAGMKISVPGMPSSLRASP